MIQSSRNFVRMLILIMSRSSSKLGHVGLKTRLLGQILEKLLYTLECTVLIQSSLNFFRMLMIIIYRSSLKLGHVGSKTGSLGQILEKRVHSKRHSYDPKFMKLCQIVNQPNI